MVEKQKSVSINLSISDDEKEWIKIYAVKHGVPVSEIFRQHIRTLREQEAAAGGNTQEEQ